MHQVVKEEMFTLPLAEYNKIKKQSDLFSSLLLVSETLAYSCEIMINSINYDYDSKVKIMKKMLDMYNEEVNKIDKE